MPWKCVIKILPRTLRDWLCVYCLCYMTNDMQRKKSNFFHFMSFPCRLFHQLSWIGANGSWPPYISGSWLTSISSSRVDVNLVFSTNNICSHATQRVSPSICLWSANAQIRNTFYAWMLHMNSIYHIFNPMKVQIQNLTFFFVFSSIKGYTIFQTAMNT